MNKLKAYKKSGRHFRMERFCACFLALSIGLVAVTAGCFTRHFINSRNMLKDNPLFTTKFVMSKTETSGTVPGMYVSKDRTKAFVLIKFDDTVNMSSNAQNYQMFLTGANVAGNKTTLISEPTGQIYVYGTTGYLGIVLTNPQGFKPQILELTLRSNSDISATKGAAGEGATSFDKFDQCVINFNPGADSAETLDCLDAETLDPTSVYENAVVKPAEEAIRNELVDLTETLRVDLNKITEYTERLRELDVVVPDMAPDLNGDTVTGEGDSQIYVPNVVLPGGFDLDWQNKTVETGFLNDAMKDAGISDVDAFFAQQASLAEAWDTEFAGTVVPTTYYTTEGMAVTDIPSTSPKFDNINTNVMNYGTAVRTYLSDKQKYQREEMTKLLKLDADYQYISLKISVNDSESVLRCF